MAEHQPGHGEDHGDMFKLYLMVFGALTVATAISFGAYELVRNETARLVIIMLVSVIKASLVAYIFMHLKFDWGKVFCIMIPVVVMAVMLIIVLMPDLVFSWHQQRDPETEAAPAQVR